MKRLVNKSDRQLFINDLNTGFGLSQVEVEALYDRITLFNRDYYKGILSALDSAQRAKDTKIDPSIKFSYLYSSLQTELIDEQFFEFVVDIFSL